MEEAKCCEIETEKEDGRNECAAADDKHVPVQGNSRKLSGPSRRSSKANWTEEEEGATKEDIERLPKFKFRKIGDFEKQNGEIQESFGGIITECDTCLSFCELREKWESETRSCLV